MKDRIKLSICMMVKNEEKNLPRCLKSLKPLLETGLAELIIIDTGSEDNSKSIALQYTDRVYEHKWNNNFSEMRNISISYAKGEWIFIIDADERLDNEEELHKLIDNPVIDNFNTIILQVKNLSTADDESRYDMVAMQRIFRNDGQFRYEGVVHNQPISKPRYLKAKISITHFGYIESNKEVMEAKFKRTTSLLKKELEKDPSDLYYTFQLGVSYAVHGDNIPALEQFRKADQMLNNSSLEEKKAFVFIYGDYARTAYKNNELMETERISMKALTYNEEYLDLYFILGHVENKKGHSEVAAQYFKQYIDLLERYNDLEISSDVSIDMNYVDAYSKSKASFQIALYYISVGKYEEAYELYRNIIDTDEKMLVATHTLIPLEKYAEIKEVYNNITVEKDRRTFLSALEKKIKHLDRSRYLDLMKEFSLNEDIYGLFSQMRAAENEEEQRRLANILLERIDFNREPVFYAEIFDQVRDNMKMILSVLKNIEESGLQRLIRYLIEEKKFNGIFENYILDQKEESIDTDEVRVFITIGNMLLVQDAEKKDEVSEQYAGIFKKYLNQGISYVQDLYRMDKADIIYKKITNQEDRFFVIMHMALSMIREDDIKAAVNYMIEAMINYELYAKYIDNYKEEIFHLNDQSVKQESSQQLEDYKTQIKENLNNLVNAGLLEEAKELLAGYEEVIKQDIDIYSIKAVIFIMENNFEEAALVLKEGLAFADNNFDLNYNLAYVYEQTGKPDEAVKCYNKAESLCDDSAMKEEINAARNRIMEENPDLVIVYKKKLVFFVKQGMDSFLGDIINGLSEAYETKKIVVTEYQEIDKGMEWADICWFEWCDELVAYGSRLDMARDKKVFCRLHSYEAFSEYPNAVNWDNVDRIIFVADHIRDFVVKNFKVNKNRTAVVSNGVDTERYTFKDRKPGFHIAYVGYINYKKGPMLLLHTFKAIYDKDQRYKLYIAGQFQDHRYILYFEQMVKELGLQDNVIFEGWQNDLDKWLDDKNYILCTSVLESQNMSVMQAMAKGIKPIIHNFVGAGTVYDKHYLWNTMEEAVRMIEEPAYDSKEYHKFVEEKYSIRETGRQIKLLLEARKEIPLVTVGITNYNGIRYLVQCIESILQQTYSNIEILVIDDASTDGSKETILEYAKNHKNIKAICHEVNSGGASRGIQEIIENAKGKYFQWIACDDYIEKDGIENLVSYLEENTCKDYVYGDINIVDDNNAMTGKWVYTNVTKEEVIQHVFGTGSGMIPMNCLYRKSFFDRNKINWIIYRENDFSADTLNLVHFIHHGWNYGKIDKAVINYRIHSQNASHNLEKRMKASVAIFDYIIQNYNEEVYMPQIPWTERQDRQQFKMFCIAQFYYMQIKNHEKKTAIPEYLKIDLTDEQISSFCSVYAEEGLKYVNAGLATGTTYTGELQDLKNVFEQFIKDIAKQ